MLRLIVGFHQDELGDWVAELDCLHGQHVRHQPPFQERPWVTSDAGRAGRLGAELDCPLCDRSELPDGLVQVRTAGPFDETTVPAGLRRAHRVPPGTWGSLKVLEGSAGFSMATVPSTERRLQAGDRQPIPPQVDHWLSISEPVRFQIDFLMATSPGEPVPAHGFDRALLGEAVDRIPDAVVVVDAEGVIRYWNAGAKRIFGFSPDRAVGESLNLIIPERLQHRHWTAFSAAISAGKSRYGDEDLLAVPAVTADGRTISIEFSVVLLMTGDSVGYIGAVIRDVTGRRNLELELRARIRQLEEEHP